jgi:hypothetical protein
MGQRRGQTDESEGQMGGKGVEFGGTNPAVERTGARAWVKPSRIALWTPMLQMHVHLKM